MPQPSVEAVVSELLALRPCLSVPSVALLKGLSPPLSAIV